ncbi:Imm32 family immunity protein [Acanthopleuribacter pedis]|uniref:Uncharacterized protein n=1 Tax=Acanthopleuribacter pedis TaxID=442870 RepID=A0A8J7QLN9_9BACT|nr:hypothetical protein [Acanthopleuribacter pedis]MBO1323471.1 hypothetical protein [Acanthopleuribacter pedis]
MEKKVEVVCLFSDSGVPIMAKQQGSNLILEVFDGKEPFERQVHIRGNSKGLKALGEYLIAVSEVKDFHGHIDSEVYSPHFRSKNEFSLTVENQEKQKRRS